MKQGSREWLDFRKTGIGSSDAPILWRGNDAEVFSLWEEKCLGKDRNVFVTPAMQRGKDLESEALLWLVKKLDIPMFPDVTKRTIDGVPMISSLDGLSMCGEVATEIKCPTSRKIFEEAMSGEIYIDHKIQMSHHMMVWDLQRIFYQIYFSPDDAHLFTYERDEALCQKLFEVEKSFWGLVEKKVPPVAQMSGDEWMSLENAYIEAVEQEKKAKASRAEILDRMKQVSGNKAAVGSRIFLSSCSTKGRIDYDVIPELQNIDLEKYRKPDSIYWRASVVKSKKDGISLSV